MESDGIWSDLVSSEGVGFSIAFSFYQLAPPQKNPVYQLYYILYPSGSFWNWNILNSREQLGRNWMQQENTPSPG